MIYHKIQSVFKRDPLTHKFIDGCYSLPEFDYLKDLKWTWSEKVDGTNIRVHWDPSLGLNYPAFFGKTDNAQIPAKLYARLTELFVNDKFKTLYPEAITLYGEGYGAGIQSGGGYKPTQDFILFDVLVHDIWLKREDVEDIAQKLGIDVVPVTGRDTLIDAVRCVQTGIPSKIGNCPAEGLVLRPEVELKTRRGDRIITKIKTKDF